MDVRDLKKEIWKAYNEKSVWTQKSDADKFRKLLDELDNVNKVVLPKKIVDWIQEAAQPSNLATVDVMYSNAIKYGKHIDWLRKPDNHKLLLKALLYGYEVDKEIEKYVRLKGFLKTTGYLNYDVTFEKFFVDTTEPDSCTKIKFTKSWLKDNWPEYEAYNSAGLLEFEEVEDD